MNKDVKEILDDIKLELKLHNNLSELDLTYIKSRDAIKLLKHITNLQTIEQQYSAILSENAELENKITNLQEENKRLKNGYCELKVKCNNGECDCTNEEYDSMVKANMKGSLLLDDYKSRNEKAIDKISKLKPFIPNEIPSWLDELENILNGGDDNE